MPSWRSVRSASWVCHWWFSLDPPCLSCVQHHQRPTTANLTLTCSIFYSFAWVVCIHCTCVRWSWEQRKTSKLIVKSTRCFKTKIIILVFLFWSWNFKKSGILFSGSQAISSICTYNYMFLFGSIFNCAYFCFAVYNIYLYFVQYLFLYKSTCITKILSICSWRNNKDWRSDLFNENCNAVCLFLLCLMVLITCVHVLLGLQCACPASHPFSVIWSYVACRCMWSATSYTLYSSQLQCGGTCRLLLLYTLYSSQLQCTGYLYTSPFVHFVQEFAAVHWVLIYFSVCTLCTEVCCSAVGTCSRLQCSGYLYTSVCTLCTGVCCSAAGTCILLFVHSVQESAAVRQVLVYLCLYTLYRSLLQCSGYLYTSLYTLYRSLLQCSGYL